MSHKAELFIYRYLSVFVFVPTLTCWSWSVHRPHNIRKTCNFIVYYCKDNINSDKPTFSSLRLLSSTITQTRSGYQGQWEFFGLTKYIVSVQKINAWSLKCNGPWLIAVQAVLWNIDNALTDVAMTINLWNSVQPQHGPWWNKSDAEYKQL